MVSVEEHYSTCLAQIYPWMLGGVDAALAQGAAEVESLGPADADNRLALDLGAGFGMHAIPLARLGYSVTAIDSSAFLLAELKSRGEGLAMRTIEADLLDFKSHVDSKLALVVCLGDTITHVQELSQVERLVEDVAAVLAPSGRFVLTFRDYTNLPKREARFIPVRADADRVSVCFLEDAGSHVVVHDILHEREGASWRMRVSSYQKLRLPPERLLEALAHAGLPATMAPAPRGMLRATAVKA